MDTKNKHMKSTTLLFALFLLMGQTHAQRIAPDTIQSGSAWVTIQPIQHASLVLATAGKVVYADPTGGAANYAGIAPPDVIVVTDIHGDHFDTTTLRAIKTPQTILVVPKAVADKLPSDLTTNLVLLMNGENKVVSGIPIRAIPMYNLPESPTAMHTKGRGNGYILTMGGKQIYLSGDTQGIPEMRSLQHIDIAFVCMNLPYTMDVTEAADAVLAFAPKMVYPYHYRGQGGFSDVHAFKQLVDAGHKDIEVRLRNWYPAP
jgi:L-ascorbate metabolism protein UlaG (beta-lactamase superfamily)